MVALGNTLLKILGHGLPKSWNCSPDVFDSLAENPAIPMRMLHYAAQPVHDEKQFGGKYAIPSLSQFCYRGSCLI